ncbi:serine/threonine-protein kinase PLK4-like isoform X2 [Bolinopsis microptera]|uniref:serine/threonine-protein kinase PLK4-like isoform X2 n=1 Tax=Bolinopsis microptera TaxID=2820187 RepID=UPI00307951F6
MTTMYCNIGPGSRKTDFSFIRKIGRGGFGEVYEAKCISTGEVVALKVLDKRKLKKEEYRKVCNEIEIHKNIQHPSIVKMYGWFEDVNFMYLVLEKCCNGDLHHFLKRRGNPLPESEARELFAQLVDGVIHLHNSNIVHRDISLNNLLLTKDMTLKLADFGMAKRLSGPQDTHRTMCGTPNFMSPETLNNAGRGFMADCWALGVVLFHLLTGELPFEDTGVNEILRRVKSGKFHIPNSVSVDARSLIGLLLQADPRNRVSAQEILKHSFMIPAPQTVFSGESADSGHGTLDSNEFSGQNDLSDDEMKVNQFLPSFSLLPSQASSNKQRACLPAFRNALRSRMRPATASPTSSGPLKIPQRPDTSRCSDTGTECEAGRGSEVAAPAARRGKPKCLNTVRIPPRLQQRNGLEVEVCKNGSIHLRRKLKSGTEEFRVSGDGMDITVLMENAKQIRMSYSTLQPRWYGRYEKLLFCVNQVKSRTPKITIHANTASAYYMENGPEPNFQVVFKDGYRLNRDLTRCYITDPEKKVTMATQTMTPCLDMSPLLQVYLDTAKLLYKQCVAVEQCLASIDGVLFPLRMGTPPVRTAGNSSFASTTTESTQSTSYMSQMPCSMANHNVSQMPCSIATPTINEQDAQLEEKCTVGTSTPINDLRRSPSLGQLNCRSPLTPITPVRRAASMSPQKRAGSEQNPNNAGYKNEGDKENNRTLQNDEEYVKYKPGVGWLGFMNGGAKLKFKDDSELLLQQGGEVLLKHPTGPITS